MNAELELFFNRLLEALFNGAYQGLFLTAVIGLGLRLCPRANAATRHMVWLVTLLFVAALPIVHFFSPNREARVFHGSSDNAEGAQSVTFTDSREVSAGISGHPSILGTEIPDAAPANIGNNPPENGFLTDPRASWRRDSARTIQPVRFSWTPWQWQLALPGRANVILISLWIGLAIVRIGGLARQCCLLHSLKRRGADGPENVRSLFETLSQETKSSRKPRLIVSEESDVPMAVGFRTPAVLLPAKICGGDAGFRLEHVLRHELAHVARGDDWTNLVQQAIKAILFFDPAVWWLSRRLTIEREIACDDHVLAAIGAPRGYALFLTEFAGRMQGRGVAAAPAAWSNKHQLKERISMILDSKRNSSPRLARGRVGALATTAALVGILSLHIAPRLALATENGDADSSAGTATSAQSEISAAVSLETDVAAVLIAAADDNPSIDESGPRPKPQPVPEVPRAPRATAAAPIVAVAPVLAAPTAAGRAAQALPDGPLQRKRSADDAIERRLERLERLVESLLAREKGPKTRIEGHPNLNLNLKGPPLDHAFDKEKFTKLADDLAKMRGNLDAQAKAAAKLAKPSEQEIARIKEQAERIKESALWEAEKASKEARAARDVQRAKREDHRGQAGEAPAGARESLEQQRQTLEAQRNSLEKQMKAVERQIQQLEREHKKIDEQRAEEEKRVKKADRPDDSSKQDKPDGEEKPKRK